MWCGDAYDLIICMQFRVREVLELARKRRGIARNFFRTEKSDRRCLELFGTRIGGGVSDRVSRFRTLTDGLPAMLWGVSNFWWRLVGRVARTGGGSLEHSGVSGVDRGNVLNSLELPARDHGSSRVMSGFGGKFSTLSTWLPIIPIRFIQLIEDGRWIGKIPHFPVQIGHGYP